MTLTFPKDELGTFITKLAEADAFSGAVLVAHKGVPIFREAYGYANKRVQVPNTVDTKFNLGSINKLFTRAGVLQLLEKNLVGIDDSVGRYLPDLSSDVTTKVTIRHLLDHTSGLGHYWNEKFESTKARLQTVDDFIALFKNDAPAFEPGTRFLYSNSGYVILGKIIEIVSGTDYYEYMRKHIYGPARMTSSDHFETDTPVSNLAIGYTRMDQRGEPTLEARIENTPMIGRKGSPAGGGYSTIDDMLRFDIAIRNSTLLDSQHSRLLLQRTIGKDEARHSYGYAGGAPGVAALYRTYLSPGYTAVILSNYDPKNIDPLRDEIDKLISSRT